MLNVYGHIFLLPDSMQSFSVMQKQRRNGSMPSMNARPYSLLLLGPSPAMLGVGLGIIYLQI